MSSPIVMVPWWLERPVDFVNHPSPFGAYVGRAGSVEDPPVPPLPIATAARQTGWRRLHPRGRSSTGQTLRAETKRDFGLGLTLLLDDARAVALRWRPRDPTPRNDWLHTPTLGVREPDVKRTRALVDHWASSQLVVDLFGRLEPMAVAPVFENGAYTDRQCAPRRLHHGQGQLLARLFEQLPPGATVDLGRNGLTAAHIAQCGLQNLRAPHALNLTDNVVDPPFVRYLFEAPAHSLRHLRHLHCRNGLTLDQPGVTGLAQLLATLTQLASLELGLPTGTTPRDAAAAKTGGVAVEPLRLAALFTTELPCLRSLYLRLHGELSSDLSALDLRAYPRLERLGLELELTHEVLRTWRPDPPYPLVQVFFPRQPSNSQQHFLRHLLNGERGDVEAFVPQLRGWSSYFERFVSVLSPTTSWSMCRASTADRPLHIRRPAPTPTSPTSPSGGTPAEASLAADRLRRSRPACVQAVASGPVSPARVPSSTRDSDGGAPRGQAQPVLVQSARPTWAAPSTPRAYAERAAEPIDLAQTFADLDLDAPDYILFDEEGTTYCFDPDVLEQERQSRLDTPVQERSASDSFYGLAH